MVERQQEIKNRILTSLEDELKEKRLKIDKIITKAELTPNEKVKSLF